jgi:hypothetical protein
MKQLIALLILLGLTVPSLAHGSTVAPWDRPLRPVADPIITYYSVTGSHNNPADPNAPWTIEMYVETDHPVPYQQALSFHILKYQQIHYGWPRQTQWAWVWNTYSLYVAPNATWTVLYDTFQPGETYDFFNYDACCLYKFP